MKYRKLRNYLTIEAAKFGRHVRFVRVWWSKASGREVGFDIDLQTQVVTPLRTFEDNQVDWVVCLDGNTDFDGEELVCEPSTVGPLVVP